MSFSNQKLFYILNGNNGATYIVNLKDLATIKLSLNFYKARSLKQKAMKSALKVYLSGLRLFFKVIIVDTLKSQEEVIRYLKEETLKNFDFGLDENSSVLISPTRDKVIVHHHDDYFHKFAFGKSYENVKNEAVIYKLLDRPFNHFYISKFYDYSDDGTSCSFKLGIAHKHNKVKVNLVSALVEMFNVSKQTQGSFAYYLQELKRRYDESAIVDKNIINAIDKMAQTHTDLPFPLGLVHRDFKHWNMNTENGLLIYDFEEAIVDGPPLEDLFNYTIAPMISYLSTSEVLKQLLNEEKVVAYKYYLELLDIKLDFKILLNCHLIEKVLFYNDDTMTETRNSYIELFQELTKGNA